MLKIAEGSWIVAFLGVIALIYPLVPPSLTLTTFVSLCLGCLGIWLLSLRMTPPLPRFTMASITDPAPDSESL